MPLKYINKTALRIHHLGFIFIFGVGLHLWSGCSSVDKNQNNSPTHNPIADTDQAKEFPGNCDQQIQNYILQNEDFKNLYSSYLIGDTLDCGLEPVESSLQDHHDFCLAKLRLNSKGDAFADKEFQGFIAIKINDGHPIGNPFLLHTKDKSVKETATSYELKFIDPENNWIQMEIKKDRYFGDAKVKPASAMDSRKPATNNIKFKKFEAQCLVERRGNKMGKWKSADQ